MNTAQICKKLASMRTELREIRNENVDNPEAYIQANNALTALTQMERHILIENGVIQDNN